MDTVSQHNNRDRAVQKQALSARLREHTHEAHQALENTPSMRCLMSPTLTLAQYRVHLEAWWRCWSPLEKTVLSSGASTPCERELLPTPRAHRLSQDLQTLGVNLTESTPQRPLPNLQKKGWLGVAYVMQGAQMGSTVISAHLLKTLNLRDTGATFFSPCTSTSVAGHWRAWCQQLDAIELTAAEAAAAVEAARHTFAYMESHFS
jgi:heme oxygenase